MTKVIPRSDSSEIGLAELLTALHELKVEKDETRALVAEVLGLAWREVKKPSSGEKTVTTPDRGSITDRGFVPTPELKVPKPSPSPEQQKRMPDIVLDPIKHEDLTFEDSTNDSILDAIDVLEQTDIKKHMERPGYQPLLCDRWFQSLMSAMLATERASQEINWNALVGYLARGRPLKRLPFLPRPTMQRGLLLFLDRSRSMQPFWRDEEELLFRLQRLLGGHKVQECWLEVDQWSPDGPKLEPYSPFPLPLPETTPLLLVTDFSIGGDISGHRADLEPWLPLLELAQKNSCPVVALIPAPDSCWLDIIRKRIPSSFVWDRGTSITTVRRHRQRLGPGRLVNE
jgi:hypothetical protein